MIRKYFEFRLKIIFKLEIILGYLIYNIIQIDKKINNKNKIQVKLSQRIPLYEGRKLKSKFNHLINVI